METMVKRLRNLAGVAQKAGPYLFLEVLLPGGTLFALLLLLYRSRAKHRTPLQHHRGNAFGRALGNMGSALSVRPGYLVSLSKSHCPDELDGLGPLAMLPCR